MAGSVKKSEKKKNRRSTLSTKSSTKDGEDENEVEEMEDRAPSGKKKERRKTRRTATKEAIASARNEIPVQQNRLERRRSRKALTAEAAAKLAENRTLSRRHTDRADKATAVSDDEILGEEEGSLRKTKSRDSSRKNQRKRSTKKSTDGTQSSEEFSVKAKHSKKPSKTTTTADPPKSSTKKKSKSSRNSQSSQDGDRSRSDSKKKKVSKRPKEKKPKREEEEEEQPDEHPEQAPAVPAEPKSRTAPPLSSSAASNKLNRNRFTKTPSVINRTATLKRVLSMGSLASMGSSRSISSFSSNGSANSKKDRRSLLAKTATLAALSLSSRIGSNRINDATGRSIATEEAESMEDTSKSRSSSGLQKSRSMFGSFRGVTRDGGNSGDFSVDAQDNNITNKPNQSKRSLLGWAKEKMNSTTSLRGKKYSSIDFNDDQESSYDVEGAKDMNDNEKVINDGITNDSNDLIDPSQDEGESVDSFANDFHETNTSTSNNADGNETKNEKHIGRKQNRKQSLSNTNSITEDDNDDTSQEKVYLDFNHQLNPNRSSSNCGRNNQRDSNFSGVSDMNSSATINDSQCCPPILQIKALDGNFGIGDDEELSDIGDTQHPRDDPDNPHYTTKAFHEPEVIDGVTIIYNPGSDDIVHGDRGHPGTIYMIAILREYLEEHEQTDGAEAIDFTPNVYRGIRKKLKGRKFLVRTEQNYNNRTSWREATKSENMKLLGSALTEEHQRWTRKQMAGDDSRSNDDDDSETAISLEGSANNTVTIGKDENDEEASPSMSSKKKVSAMTTPEALLLSPPPPIKTESSTVVVTEDNKLTPRKNNLGISKATHKAPTLAVDRITSGDPLVEQVLHECQLANEIDAFGDYTSDAMQRGITAEEKLLSAIAMVDIDDGQPADLSSDTELLREELNKLKELTRRIKYASIAPLLERVEQIETNVAKYLNRQDRTRKEKKQQQESETGKTRQGKTNSQLDNDDSRKEGDSNPVELDNDVSDELREEKDCFDRQHGTKNGDADEKDDEAYGNVGKDDVEHNDGSDSDESKSEPELVLNLNTTSDELSSVGDSGIYSEETEEESLDRGDVKYIDDEGELKKSYHSEYSDFDLYSDDDKPDVDKTPFEKPNPKLQQFFDRLRHLFETRRRLQERTDAIDPSSKCQKIKAKAHSGGIVTKQGRYKQECQQRDQNDHLVRNLDDLYDAGQLALPEFQSLLRNLISEVNGLHKDSLMLPKLKPRDRAFDKANEEYHDGRPSPPESWLYDIVRAGIICTSFKQLKDVNNWLATNAHLVQAKNRFIDPVFNGYRDLLYHVSIPYLGGLDHICEIQVHLKDIYVTNEQYGMINHYEFFRSCFSNQRRSQDDILSDLLMTNEHGAIAGPLMKKLLKSEDVEQLRLFAGLFRDKVDEFERSLELYRRILNLQEIENNGSEHLDMANTYLGIGQVLGALGDTDNSLLNMLKALAIQESLLGLDHIEVADSYVEIGHMLSKKGDYSGAYTQYQRTLMIRENKLGNDHLLVIKSLQDIGLVLQKKGDFKESEIEYRRALSIQKEVLGEGHLDTATTHSLIGKTLCLYGDFTKAMVENETALSIRKKKLGKNHPTSAESHTAIGEICYHQGAYKSSKWHHGKALWIRETVLGKDCQECAIAHSALGELLSRCGDYEGAVSKLRRAQKILEMDIGMDHPVTAGCALDLGHIHSRHGKHKMALAEYRRAKVIRESVLGSNHPETALTYTCIGNALSKTGNHKGAVAMHKKALDVFKNVLGEKHPLTATGYQSIGDTLTGMGKLEAALKEQRKALIIRRATLMNDHPDIVDSLLRIGTISLMDDPKKNPCYDAKEALDVFHHALDSVVTRCGEDHPEVVPARFDVARALMALIDDNDIEYSREKLLGMAEHGLRAALSVLRKSVDPSSTESKNSGSNSSKDDSEKFEQILDEAIMGKACVALGTVLETRGNPDEQDEAKDLYKEGFECLLAVLGGEDPETKNAEQKFMSFCVD